jgi:hypothetical protein
MADPATGAPPAADVGAAPAAPAIPAADPSAGFQTHQELLDAIHQLTPQEARELHAEYSATYHRQPAPLVASTPAEADQRLAMLATDAEWWGRFTRGDPATVKEWHDLNALKADLTVLDPLVEQFGYTTTAPELGGPSLTRRQQISVAADLRAQGASDEEIQRIYINNEPYPEHVEADARFWGPRLKDPNVQVPSPYSEVDRENLIRFYDRVLRVNGSGPF